MLGRLRQSHADIDWGSRRHGRRRWQRRHRNRRHERIDRNGRFGGHGRCEWHCGCRQPEAPGFGGHQHLRRRAGRRGVPATAERVLAVPGRHRAISQSLHQRDLLEVRQRGEDSRLEWREPASTSRKLSARIAVRVERHVAGSILTKSSAITDIHLVQWIGRTVQQDRRRPALIVLSEQIRKLGSKKRRMTIPSHITDGGSSLAWRKTRRPARVGTMFRPSHWSRFGRLELAAADFSGRRHLGVRDHSRRALGARARRGRRGLWRFRCNPRPVPSHRPQLRPRPLCRAAPLPQLPCCRACSAERPEREGARRAPQKAGRAGATASSARRGQDPCASRNPRRSRSERLDGAELEASAWTRPVPARASHFRLCAGSVRSEHAQRGSTASRAIARGTSTGFRVRRARLRVNHGWEHAAALLELDGNTFRHSIVALRRAEASLLWRGPDRQLPLAQLDARAVRSAVRLRVDGIGSCPAFHGAQPGLASVVSDRARRRGAFVRRDGFLSLRSRADQRDAGRRRTLRRPERQQRHHGSRRRRGACRCPR